MNGRFMVGLGTTWQTAARLFNHRNPPRKKESTMKKTALTLALAAAAALPSLAWALTARQAVEVMDRHQYAAPQDLKKQYGYWTADAVSADGTRVTVLIDDKDGGITAIQDSDIGGKLPSVEQVTQHLRSTGFAVVQDLELDDGFWHAEVRPSGRGGEKQELVLHPGTLQVLSRVGPSGGTINGQPALSAAQVQQALQQAGYTRVSGIEFDDGVWEAEAVNTANLAVELRVDPVTGKVLRERLDD